jgi:hypothetical protein
MTVPWSEGSAEDFADLQEAIRLGKTRQFQSNDEAQSNETNPGVSYKTFLTLTRQQHKLLCLWHLCKLLIKPHEQFELTHCFFQGGFPTSLLLQFNLTYFTLFQALLTPKKITVW